MKVLPVFIKLLLIILYFLNSKFLTGTNPNAESFKPKKVNLVMVLFQMGSIVLIFFLNLR